MDLDQIRKIAGIIVETAPSAGMSKEEKSEVVKAAKSGKDIGAKGKNFEKIAKKAAAKYGSKEAGEKVAGAVMWKKMAKEDVEYTDEEIASIVESYDDEDDMTPAEKELAKMGKGLSAKDEKKIDKADKKAEDKAVKKTSTELDDEAKEAAAEKKAAALKAKEEAEAKKEADKASKDDMEESLAYYRLNAGMPSDEVIIEGEKDADVYLVITEAKSSAFSEHPAVKDIQIFKDAISAEAFVRKMKGAVKSAQVIGKKFAQVKMKK